jgi:hypothetical protein
MRRRHRKFRDYRGNPLSTGQKVAIVGAAAVVVGLVGYYWYESQQSSGTTAQLGSGGSTTPLPTTVGAGGSTTALPSQTA